MTKSLSKFLLSLSVTPFLVFGTPALMVTSAHADAEISSDVSDDDGAWSDGEVQRRRRFRLGRRRRRRLGRRLMPTTTSIPTSGDGCGDDYAVSRC